MKTSQHDATDEKRILTGMIVSGAVLGRVADKWTREGLFRVRWANLVGGWCADYFRRYGAAPRRDIEGLFEAWAAGSTDESTVELVDRFLSELSDDYEQEAEDINPDYLVDMAGAHFNMVQLERMSEVVNGHIQAGHIDKAMDAVAGWGRVEMGMGAGVELLSDRQALVDAFEDKAEPLITYPGDLGRFFGDQLGRDEFVAITGATGRGKTWWLMDIAWMAVRQRRRVAFFEVGDMSQGQIIRRFASRITGRPTKPPYSVNIPTNITRDADGEVEIRTENKMFEGPLTPDIAWLEFEKRTHRRPSAGSLLRISVHPNSTVNVGGISSVLDVWERDGWVPDVVVVDYADILAVPQGFVPGDRESINQTWKEFRGLSQRRHILVVTATQADAASYTAHLIGRSNFSDDRRKNDHVTGMLGINATEEEQSRGIFRLNWVKRREEAYTETRCVYVAGCLGIGRPHICSTF